MKIAHQVGIVLAILIGAWLLVKLIKKTMAKRVRFAKIDSIQYKFLGHFINGFIYFIGIVLAVYSIPSIRGIAAPVFAGSGVLAIIIGFAAQQAFSNIVGGIFIAMFSPFRIGDRLKLVDKNFIGIVEDITLRHTILRTFDYKRIIIPNSVISSEVLENENIIDQKMIKHFEICISFDSDIDKAIGIIEEEALNHRDFLDNRTDEQRKKNEKPVKVRVLGFSEYAVILRAYIWTATPSAAFDLGCDLNKSVKERFQKEGIEIPYPYRTIVAKG